MIYSHYNQPQKNQPQKPDEQLYNHLIKSVKLESPSDVLLRFQALFTDSANYPDANIQQALNQAIGTDLAEENFKAIFNRCCYILVNNWRNQPGLQWAVNDLLSVINDFSSESYCSSAHRLHQLLCNFTQSEEYLQLQQLQQSVQSTARGSRSSTAYATTAQVDSQSNEGYGDHPEPSGYLEHSEGSQPLRAVIDRYPFLYDHCLINRCHTTEQRAEKERQKVNVQEAFASDLHNYYVHHVKNPGHGGSGSYSSVVLPRNPTNLSDDELRAALKHFTGPVQHDRTYQGAAQDFLKQSKFAPNFRVFKDDFYEYLTATVKPYGNRRVHEKLQECLRKSQSQHDAQKTNRLLPMVCKDLLKFLVIDSKDNPQHSIFIDLHTNIGSTRLIGLLLKIALLCKEAKEFLEKQIAVLFDHHSTNPRREVNWLEKSLDHLNVALCTHFDRPDFLAL